MTGFVPERIEVFVQFDTQHKGQTSGGKFDGSAILRTETGKIHFCYPMRHAWEPNIKRPFSVRFLLVRRFDGATSSVIASSEVVTFPVEEEAVAGEAASNGASR